ncbi:MAG: Rieske (2Fe-2S) protein [Pseudonocardia sp.]
MTNPTSPLPPAAAPEPAPGLSRRAVGAGVGGGAAAGLRTACGGGSTATAPATTAAAEPAPSASSGTELTSTSDVPVGGGTVFADKDVVVTQPTAGAFKAFSATCTHQGCKVKSVADGVIVCPCHGSKFAIADGAVTAGPAKSPLPAKTISVDGDSILLT